MRQCKKFEITPKKLDRLIKSVIGNDKYNYCPGYKHFGFNMRLNINRCFS